MFLSVSACEFAWIVVCLGICHHLFSKLQAKNTWTFNISEELDHRRFQFCAKQTHSCTKNIVLFVSLD